MKDRSFCESQVSAPLMLTSVLCEALMATLGMGPKVATVLRNVTHI